MDDEYSGLGFERVVFFSDGVFAIVITLLVLPLTGEIRLPEGTGTAAQVVTMLPQMVTFVVSFLVVGQIWVAHRRTFGRLRRADPGLVWLNLLILLTVAFMPFPVGAARGTPQWEPRPVRRRLLRGQHDPHQRAAHRHLAVRVAAAVGRPGGRGRRGPVAHPARAGLHRRLRALGADGAARSAGRDRHLMGVLPVARRLAERRARPSTTPAPYG
jgi:Endosomal/lysosomal potassium channel TMEM175